MRPTASRSWFPCHFGLFPHAEDPSTRAPSPRRPINGNRTGPSTRAASPAELLAVGPVTKHTARWSLCSWGRTERGERLRRAASRGAAAGRTSRPAGRACVHPLSARRWAPPPNSATPFNRRVGSAPAADPFCTVGFGGLPGWGKAAPPRRRCSVRFGGGGDQPRAL